QLSTDTRIARHDAVSRLRSPKNDGLSSTAGEDPNVSLFEGLVRASRGAHTHLVRATPALTSRSCAHRYRSVIKIAVVKRYGQIFRPSHVRTGAHGGRVASHWRESKGAVASGSAI